MQCWSCVYVGVITHTSHKVGSKIFEDNFNVAMSTVVSGNNFSKVNLFSDFLKMPIFSLTTFHAYQHSYIVPGINRFHAKQVYRILHKQLIMFYVLIGENS